MPEEVLYIIVAALLGGGAGYGSRFIKPKANGTNGYLSELVIEQKQTNLHLVNMKETEKDHHKEMIRVLDKHDERSSRICDHFDGLHREVMKTIEDSCKKE